MVTDDQNTVAGGGSPVTQSTGNSFLDAFLNITNVGVTAAGNLYGLYDSIKDAELARRIEAQNAYSASKQESNYSARDALSPLTNYLGDGENLQRVLALGALGVLGIAGIIWAFKRA